MGIFDKIKSAILGADEEEAAPSATVSPEKPVIASASTAGAATQPAQAPTASAPADASAKPVDVAAMLDEAVRKNGQKLDWRRSIVDLMKALGMDSSLSNRKELAAELNYGGDTGDSASMNIWLHKALMKKLADHGGRVPPELLD